MKRSLFAVIFIFIFLMPAGFAQQVELFGYYEPQYLGINLRNEYSQLFSNKLRVDLASSPADNVKFAANFDYITYQGKTVWNLLDYIPRSVSRSVPPEMVPGFDFIYGDTIFLDNAYLKIALPTFDITIGRQQISFGSGYVWNPTDLFNFKDYADPTYEQPGHDAIRIDLPVGSRYGFNAMYLPEGNWESSGKLLRFKGGFFHFDYAFTYIERQWQLSDFTFSQPVDNNRRLFGGEFTGELFGLGIWGEYGYNTLEPLDDFWEIVLGTDYTLDNGTYLMAEYYYNGLAKSDYRDYDLNDWTRFFMAESKSVSRDNLYLYVDYPLTDLIHLNNSAVVSLPDMSLALIPGLNYSLYQDVELTVFINVYVGKEKMAYNSDLGTGGIVRLRVYF